MAANLTPLTQASEAGDLEPFEARFRRTTSLRPAAPSYNV
jgi:hypothetical protein